MQQATASNVKYVCKCSANESILCSYFLRLKQKLIQRILLGEWYEEFNLPYKACIFILQYEM